MKITKEQINNLVNITVLKPIIEYYTNNNLEFKTLFTLNVNTPFESSPYDLFKAHYMNQALITNKEKEITARFNMLFIENSYIFKQISHKITLINKILEIDTYANSSTSTNSVNQLNSQTSNTTNNSTSNSTNKNNFLVSDNNSFNNELNAKELNTLKANNLSQSFTVNDLTDTNINTLNSSNTLNINGQVVNLSNNQANAIKQILTFETINFRKKFIESFRSLFTSITTIDNENAALLAYPEYLTVNKFNSYIKDIYTKLKLLELENINQEQNINDLSGAYSASLIIKKRRDNEINSLINKNKELIKLLQTQQEESTIKINQLINEDSKIYQQLQAINFFNEQLKENIKNDISLLTSQIETNKQEIITNTNKQINLISENLTNQNELIKSELLKQSEQQQINTQEITKINNLLTQLKKINENLTSSLTTKLNIIDFEQYKNQLNNLNTTISGYKTLIDSLNAAMSQQRSGLNSTIIQANQLEDWIVENQNKIKRIEANLLTIKGLDRETLSTISDLKNRVESLEIRISKHNAFITKLQTTIPDDFTDVIVRRSTRIFYQQFLRRGEYYTITHSVNLIKTCYMANIRFEWTDTQTQETKTFIFPNWYDWPKDKMWSSPFYFDLGIDEDLIKNTHYEFPPYVRNIVHINLGKHNYNNLYLKARNDFRNLSVYLDLVMIYKNNSTSEDSESEPVN